MNVYRFAVYVYVSGPSLRSSEKAAAFPTGPSGGSRAEAQRRGGVFQLAWGGGTGIDFDFDFDFDSDNDLTDRQPLVHVLVLAASSCT